MPVARDLEVNDPKVLLDRIRKEFPQINWESYEFINHGWDHEVIILDKKLVFRFPASSEYLPALKEEVRLMKHLHSKIDFPMPHYKYVAKDNSFAGYAMLPGVELSKELFDRLDISDKKLLAMQLADFLSQFHAIDIGEIRPFNIGQANLSSESLELSKNAEKYLHSVLGEDEFRQVLDILKILNETVNGQLPRTLTHNDISPKHLLWDLEEKQLSVIDFSDRSISDPAMDFAELFIYGLPFVRSVYALYKAKKDDNFLKRALIYYKRVGISMLINSFQTERQDFSEAKTLFSDAVKQTKV
ncbi:MAG TPA: aminoglycoside phosphotransferase family protein [Candidatus Saccharimonadales bacterium]|nr:aminoglycoside phosphotransferase family protein [Candidatus Saccharimonadales bacterium]